MENFGGSLAENVWRKISAFKKYSIFGLGSTLYLSLSVSVCLCLFVSLCLGGKEKEMSPWRQTNNQTDSENKATQLIDTGS